MECLANADGRMRVAPLRHDADGRTARARKKKKALYCRRVALCDNIVPFVYAGVPLSGGKSGTFFVVAQLPISFNPKSVIGIMMTTTSILEQMFFCFECAMRFICNRKT